MKITIIIIASAFFLASCHGHSYRTHSGEGIKIIDDARIYDFLNTTKELDLNNNREINYIPIHYSSFFQPEIFMNNDTKSAVFTEEDIASMKKQFEMVEGKIWDSNKLSSIKLIDFKLLENGYNDGCASLSAPLFSIDGNKCFIAVIYACCGPVSGSDQILLFIKEHGEWLLKDRKIVGWS